MKGQKNALERQVIRLLQFLADVGSARLNLFDNGSRKEAHTLLVANQEQPRQMLVSNAILNHSAAADLVAREGELCALTRSGRAHLRRHQTSGSTENNFAEQHRHTVVETIMMAGEQQTVRRNQHESPLARLRIQRMKDGRSFLSDAAYEAGERLRSDFTRAQLMPSVTSNWNAAMGGDGGSQRRDGQGGKVALSDNALDAQHRFNQALKYVGPDLSDVLIDVCCYLKGLQKVEREQGWPPRSAKLMVRTGLGLLAQFYGTVPGVRESA